MKHFILLCVCVGYMQTAAAQDKPIKLFPEGVPGGADTGAEKRNTEGNRVAGGNVLRITNVSQPTITIYQPPQEFAAGSAVIVCPGRGRSPPALRSGGRRGLPLAQRSGHHGRAAQVSRAPT